VTTECTDHVFAFQGMVYHFGRQEPGSSAHEMIYEDRYYCTRCLLIVDKNARHHANSYQKKLEGAVPK
jgi:hypothetical protein